MVCTYTEIVNIIYIFATYSAMPRGPVKRIIRRCVPEDYYRPLYSFVSAAYILCTFYFWVPISSVVWDIHMPTVRNAIYGKEDRSSAYM